ncbi:MAG TPA: hypothetical protein DCL15_11835 [Chloroflexi bacterium]|nr:hypothetical protein [Chloroflexota bacterium]HHW87595.1 hypothetical protein [Chloroflexota bacterium]
MISRRQCQWLVIGAIFLAAILIAVATGPICLPLPAGIYAGPARCYLWVTPDASSEAAPLALVSLPPDWNPAREGSILRR